MTENDLISTYSSSHQNKTNQVVHYVCVPIIFFNVVAFFYALSPFLAMALSGVSLIFYYRSLRSYFSLMIILILVSLSICYIFAPFEHFLKTNILLFVLAWIGQFWGHKVEGKNPSFLQNLLFLLVGPAWIMAKFRARLISKA